jgi:hypothetical protein
MARLKDNAASPNATISKKQRLLRELANIDKRVETGTAAERSAMIDALWEVEQFLGFPGSVLYQLRIYLRELDYGITVPALKANKKPAGRKRDSPDVQELKGRLAGIARLQMESGMSREDAAAWVSRKIPAELASRLSSKPFISTRAVKEYMDLYDCGTRVVKKFEQLSEREEFAFTFSLSAENGDSSSDRSVRQIEFLRSHAPARKMRMYKRKKLNPMSGEFGFMMQIYLAASCRAEGYEPSCIEFLKELARLAVERIPSPASAAPPDS